MAAFIAMQGGPGHAGQDLWLLHGAIARMPRHRIGRRRQQLGQRPRLRQGLAPLGQVGQQPVHGGGAAGAARIELADPVAMLLAGVLLLLGIASSKFSARIGVPVLVLFLTVGMLAGSEGLGRIPFENYGLANSIGSVALALILFDGGLRTSIASVQRVWKPALALSTLGVLLTSLITGLAAAWVLQLPLLQGLLVGSIVGSTDAAAVFAVLRSSGLKLPERLTSILEVESGSNDPMAIFLTLGLVGVIIGTADSTQALLWLFVGQFGRGHSGRAADGAPGHLGYQPHQPRLPGPLSPAGPRLWVGGLWAGGGAGRQRLSGCLHRRDRAGQQLHRVPARDLFLPRRHRLVGADRAVRDAGAAQLPQSPRGSGLGGLLIALVLILVARPLAVWASALPFQFRRRELTFISWVGLKGAVPITLATFPLLAGVPKSGQIFNAVFFVVLLSALTQGWSLPLVARWLQIGRPADPTPALSVEINALRQVDGEISITPCGAGPRRRRTPHPHRPPLDQPGPRGRRDRRAHLWRCGGPSRFRRSCEPATPPDPPQSARPPARPHRGRATGCAGPPEIPAWPPRLHRGRWR
jgi:potassium/hydrogen antiporter